MNGTGSDKLWDAWFPLLRLEGSGTRAFLHGQTSADVNGANESQLIRSCWLSATGRLQALLEIRLDSSGADVLVLAGDAEALASGFDRVIFPADRVRLLPIKQQHRQQRLRSELSDTSWHEDVQWSGDASRSETASSQSTAIAAATAPTTASAEELERWRLGLGLPLGTGELNGETNPLELGLGEWLSLSKGCYLGQETIAKVAGRQGVKQQLRCWQLPAEATTTAAPLTIAAGQQLLQGDERAGVITSVLAREGRYQGLALVRRAALEASHLQLAGLATEHPVEIQLDVPAGFRDPELS